MYEPVADQTPFRWRWWTLGYALDLLATVGGSPGHGGVSILATVTHQLGFSRGDGLKLASQPPQYKAAALPIRWQGRACPQDLSPRFAADLQL